MAHSTKPLRIGNNPGWYGNHYTDQDIHRLMALAGNLSTRYFISLPQWEQYGMDTFTERIKEAYNMGFRGNVYAFTGQFHTAYKNQDDTRHPAGPSEPAGATVQSMLPKGLYKDIFLPTGGINPENIFACYVAEGMLAHSQYFDYFEIWNEPDITYNTGDADDPNLAHTPGSWWHREPQPWEIYQLHAKIGDYVRLCEVGYKVIKKMKPDAQVCTGGLGYPAFGYWFHRLGGHKWYDVLSVHIYPMYYTRKWDNAAGQFLQHRHSDYALQRCLARIEQWQNILAQFGKTNKEIICTEINLPRNSSNPDMDYGAEMQVNWTIKLLVKFLQAGVDRTWLYVAGEVREGAGPAGFEKMGLYQDLTDAEAVGKERLAPQGIACRTVNKHLVGAVYDPKLTASLNLPEGIDGVGMMRSKKKAIVLWAKTVKDKDEANAWPYKFPPTFKNAKIKAFRWDGSEAIWHFDNANTLTGSPIIFIEQ